MAVAALCACGRVGFIESAAGDAVVDDAAVTNWSRVFAGDQTTCGVFQGRGYCWGRGTNREIGDGGSVNRASPAAIAVPPGTVTQIAQGEGHGCAIVDDAAYCWGNAPPGHPCPASAMPVAVTMLPTPVTSISAGEEHTCAVAAGAVYCWGVEQVGCLGNGAAGSSMTPVLVALPTTAVAVDSGNDHTMALLVDDSVSVWGHNDSGTFGTGSFTPNSSDVPVASAATKRLPSLGGWHACTLVADATYCWGQGTMGELGNGLSTNSASPVAVPSLGANVTSVVANGGPMDFDASCAIVGGAVRCWGNGLFGRLGQGTTNNEPTPVAVEGLPSDIVEIALGYDHACARSADGTLRCWGRGDSGQLGDGASVSSLTPVIVPTP